MTEFISDKSSRSLKDNDSGIGFDYSSSSDLYSSQTTSIEPRTQTITFPIPGLFARKRINHKPLIQFPSDGIIERIRPITLRNSENSDFIICRTARGPYIAYRTPDIPSWVSQLVREIDSRQN